MPPQNTSYQTPPTPPVTPTQPTPPTNGQGFSMDSLQKNQKFMTTIKTFVIYGCIIYAINVVVNMVISTLNFSSSYNPFSIAGIIMALVVGAIGAAIGGAIFYFLYDPIHNWVKRNTFLSRHIHNMFTLFWKPFLVFAVIGAIFGLLGILGLGGAVIGYGVSSFGGLFIGWAIGFIVNIATFYWYSKMVSAKLEPLYPW